MIHLKLDQASTTATNSSSASSDVSLTRESSVARTVHRGVSSISSSGRFSPLPLLSFESRPPPLSPSDTDVATSCARPRVIVKEAFFSGACVFRRVSSPRALDVGDGFLVIVAVVAVRGRGVGAPVVSSAVLMPLLRRVCR